MKFKRFAAAIAVTISAAAFPASSLAGSSSPASPKPAKLSSSAPARLSQPASAASNARAGHTGDLPYTGVDLLPETLAGVILVGVGVALRIRRG